MEKRVSAEQQAMLPSKIADIVWELMHPGMAGVASVVRMAICDTLAADHVRDWRISGRSDIISWVLE